MSSESTETTTVDIEQPSSKEIVTVETLSPVPVTKSIDPADVVKVPLEKHQVTMVCFGLCIGLFMASLDSTIVGASLKSVVEDLGRQELIPWIGSAYLMSAAAVGALYGKFADLFGRKWVWITSLVLFEIGSIICGAAPNMIFLIAGRMVAGLGGGGIFAMAYVVIADIVSPNNRGKYQTLVTLTYGGASCIAPLVGGVFADFASWRWSFYINLPLGVIAVASSLYSMKFPTPPGTFYEKAKRVDALGVFFLFTAVAALVAALQLGGSTFAWSSVPIISLFLIWAVLTACLIYVELNVAVEPIIPAKIFVNNSVAAILITAFALGAFFFAGLYYMSLFFQVIHGDTSTQAGVKSIAFVAGYIILSVTTGFTVSKTGRYKIFFYIGAGFATAGIALTSSMTRSTTLFEKLAYLFIFGLGGGVLVSLRMLAAQFSVPVELISIASAVTQTMGKLGGSVGVAISGTIFNNHLLSVADSLPTLSVALVELSQKGYSVDPTDVLQVSQLLINVSGLSVNGTTANEELVGAFGDAFRVVYLTLLLPLGAAIHAENIQIVGGKEQIENTAVVGANCFLASMIYIGLAVFSYWQ
ncbi:UNVERIFIED_CONTAM: hypothetical protein HDU68_000339, partial [Siphonaria sp. JEL0065]